MKSAESRNMPWQRGSEARGPQAAAPRTQPVAPHPERARRGHGAKESVLVVDDLPDNLHLMQMMLRGSGYEATLAESGREALRLFGERRPDLCLIDLQMPEMDGIELLRALRQIEPELPVVVITAFGSIDAAVEAMKAGAADFVVKPIRREKLLGLLDQHARSRRRRSADALASGALRQMDLIARSPQMLRTLSLATEAAATDATVLLTGESGVGKEVVARFIHQHSRRRDAPFFAVNCAAISESLVESELFGYERGAFTGAFRRKSGLLEQGSSGTLLLDEIGDMPLAVQAKLLRVIETREMLPVGGTRPVPVDARLIAATNADLGRMVSEGAFRADLFFRLNMFAIEIPPLRERREEILPIATRVLEQIAAISGGELPGFSKDAVDYLMTAPWTGNVRELVHAVERAAIVCRGSLLTAADFPREVSIAAPSSALDAPAPTAVPLEGLRFDEVERRALLDALERSDHNVSRAARLLGIGRGALRSRLRRHRIAVA